jgi:hypothetical protein
MLDRNLAVAQLLRTYGAVRNLAQINLSNSQSGQVQRVADRLDILFTQRFELSNRT